MRNKPEQHLWRVQVFGKETTYLILTGSNRIDAALIHSRKFFQKAMRKGDEFMTMPTVKNIQYGGTIDR